MKRYLTIEPPAGLLEKILFRIKKEQRFLAIRQGIIFFVFLACSVVLFWPALIMLLSDISKSGFIYFFSLLFSDFSTVLTFWQSFIMTLLETLPAVSIAIFLAVVVIFLQSVKILAKDIKTIIKYA